MTDTEDLYLFQVLEQRPLGVDILQGHVDSACALGLTDPFARRRLDIIANGPSASLTPWDELATTMALNGALDLFKPRGWAPAFWAACDPQPLVTDFLAWTPASTTYLVASQCHPSVFTHLRQMPRLRVFHLADGVDLPASATPIRHGSSITLTMLWNAPLLGFFDIHVWGWDCCVDPITFAAHAAPREGATLPELRVLEHRTEPHGPTLRSFLTTNTWAFEAQQAVFIVQELRRLGVHVHVHGDGLVHHTLAFHTTLETSANANARAA